MVVLATPLHLIARLAYHDAAHDLRLLVKRCHPKLTKGL